MSHSHDWKPVARYEVIDRPEYFCELEEFRRGQDQMMFIHMNIWKWSLETLKLAKRDFDLLRKCVTCPLYACGDVDDKKWSGFVKLFGFKFLQRVRCTDGKTRRLFIHIQDDKNNALKSIDTTTVVAEHPAVVRTSPISDTSVQRSEQRA